MEKVSNSNNSLSRVGAGAENDGHPHIGQLIEAALEDIGMTKAEFGRRIGTSRQNVSLILKKAYITTDVLWKISIVLKVNFFERLTNLLAVEHGIGELSSESELEIKLTVPDTRLMEMLTKMFLIQQDGKLNF